MKARIDELTGYMHLFSLCSVLHHRLPGVRRNTALAEILSKARKCLFSFGFRRR